MVFGWLFCFGVFFVWGSLLAFEGVLSCVGTVLLHSWLTG